MKLVVIGGTSGMGARRSRRPPRALGWDVVSAGRRGDAFVDVTDPASVEALFERSGRSITCSSPPRPAGPGRSWNRRRTRRARSWTASCSAPGWPRATPSRGCRPGGSITFITGVAVVRPPRAASTVVAAFAGVEALTRALALELGPIRVNTIRPGYTDTEMWGEDRTELRAKVAPGFPPAASASPRTSPTPRCS